VRYVILALVAVLCSATTARAQSVTPRWDVAFMTGGFSGHPETPPSTVNTFDNWYQTGQFGFTAGRYFSPHFKTEIAFAATGEARHQLPRFALRSDLSYNPIYYTDQLIQVRSLSAGVGWQFLDNQWVHPYLMVGLGADHERLTSYTREQFAYTTNLPPNNRVTIAPETRLGPTTTTKAHGWASAGAKFFVAEKAFIRGELRFGFTDRVHNVGTRIGLGIDF
jgi:opacity protein-like surface antigen